MLLCANSMFGQKENALSLSLEEIKDMSQKIIKAYFRPVYTSNSSLKFEIKAKQFYAASQRVL